MLTSTNTLRHQQRIRKVLCYVVAVSWSTKSSNNGLQFPAYVGVTLEGLLKHSVLGTTVIQWWYCVNHMVCHVIKLPSKFWSLWSLSNQIMSKGSRAKYPWHGHTMIRLSFLHYTKLSSLQYQSETFSFCLYSVWFLVNPSFSHSVRHSSICWFSPSISKPAKVSIHIYACVCVCVYGYRQRRWLGCKTL